MRSWSERLFWMDRHMPEPSLDPPHDDEIEMEAMDCKRCLHREHCQAREEWGDTFAEICDEYEVMT